MTESQLTIQRLAPDDDRLAELFDAKAPGFFASPGWCEVLARGFHTRCWYYCLMEGDKVIAGLPGVVINLKVLKLFYASMPYGGVVGQSDRLGELVDGLSCKLRSDGIDVLRIVRTALDDFPPLEGFLVRSAMQHLLTFDQKHQDLVKALPSSIRRNIKKAQSFGIEVVPIQSREEMNEVFEIYHDTMTRKGAAVFWPMPFMEAVYDCLIPGGRAEVYVARKEGKTLAAMILLHDNDITFYFLGSSRVESLPMRPNDVLFQTAIQRSIDSGRKVFDFMTSGPQDEGLARFKEKWGALREPFQIYEKPVSLKGKLFWKPAWWIGNSRIGARIGRLIGLWG